MTKNEYLAELSMHLVSLPDEERDNAVRFYDEYFDDAGIENEQAVIEELGKPFALAKSIITEQSEYSKSKSYAKYRESKSLGQGGEAPSAPQGEPDTAPDSGKQEQPHTQYTAYNYSYKGAADTSADVGAKTGSYEEYKQNYGTNENNTYSGNPYSGSTYSSYTTTNSNTAILVIGIIFGAIFIAPALLGLIMALCGCAVAIFFMALAAAFCTVFGVLQLASGGMFLIGLALAIGGAALLLTVPTVLGFGKLLPWIFKMIGRFFKKYSGSVT